MTREEAHEYVKQFGRRHDRLRFPLCFANPPFTRNGRYAFDRPVCTIAFRSLWVTLGEIPLPPWKEVGR